MDPQGRLRLENAMVFCGEVNIYSVGDNSRMQRIVPFPLRGWPCTHARARYWKTS